MFDKLESIQQIRKTRKHFTFFTIETTLLISMMYIIRTLRRP